jgi:putative transposase
VKFINAHRERWGVEPICKVLQFAPSTYYAAVSRPLSARKQRDEQLKVEIARVHRDNFGAYGIEKVWRQLNREGIQVGRDRVHRLMDEMDVEGVVRGKRKPITTMSNEVDTRPDDLVERDFTASAPNALWVADLTYVCTLNGFCYVAFVVDVFSRSSSAGVSHARCTPMWPSMRSRWPSGSDGVIILPVWCTTVTEVSSTRRSATPSDSKRLVR